MRRGVPIIELRTHRSRTEFAGVLHRIDDHFGVGIPEQKAINPFGNADWEGTGVEPDVKVNARDALETAVRLAEATLQNRYRRPLTAVQTQD